MKTITLSCEFCKNFFVKGFYIHKYTLINRPNNKFYCSKQCQKLAKESKPKVQKELKKLTCGFCLTEFVPKSGYVKKPVNGLNYCNLKCANTHLGILRVGKTRRRKNNAPVVSKNLCKTCFKVSTKSKVSICKDCKLSLPLESILLNKTKEEVFKERKNWQSARSAIRKLAHKTYVKHYGESLKCFICSYSTYVEICHLKAVKDFSDSSTIKEINDISNLIALCPNHHWEQEHGLVLLN